MEQERDTHKMEGRDRPIIAGKTALLVIDAQYYIAAAGHGEYSHIDPDNIPPDLSYFFSRVENNIIANTKRLQEACRQRGIEVMFTVVENMTLDGRDRGLDYKISQFNVPKGSHGAKVLDPIGPVGDEMVFPKTTSSVFNSTTIDYVLRNLGVEQLIITGLLTDQCVESSVRDACDKGYIVKLVEDAC
ncbi:MAG: isochorismatase family cysteine hydrolase, partial [Kordiimonas sp.]